MDSKKLHLAPYGYFEVAQTPGLWRHTDRRTTFTLAVDYLGIKFFSQPNADCLFDALAAKYALTKDWTGSSYPGFKIAWNYAAGHIDISVLDYIPKELLTLRHPSPACPQHSQHCWNAPVYGKTLNWPTPISLLFSTPLGIKHVQQISGDFLYYSRGCNPTIIVALIEISNRQSSPTKHTQKACNMLLNYSY
jgi:hypothetical protein